MNEQLKKDIAKYVKNQPLNQELSPGSTPRRWVPEGGEEKHRHRIHKESKYADEHKNLPFSFRKPPKPRGRSIYVKCDNCGYIMSANTATVGIICPDCKKFSSVTRLEDND
jgi:hypothetical protein